ncbi:MAG: hypothetical protein P4L77_02855 [Sulfuriferula sp.]|nr:hypothetical protein [Sulfuriferula sp.]
MHMIFKFVVTFSLLFILVNHAEADQQEADKQSQPGVMSKVEHAVEHGAKVAATGVEHGVKAAGRGIERGAKAAGRGIDHGVKATKNAVGRVVDKTDKSSSTQPDPTNK